MSADPFASLLPKEGCPSELELDRWHAKELPAARMQALESHAANCTDCQARMKQRAQGFAAIAAPAGQPPIDERRVLAGLRRRLDEEPPRMSLFARRLSVLAGFLACAAAFALVALPKHDRQGEEYEVRAKGGLALHVFREQNGRASEALSGDQFHAGERLRFVADLPSDGEVRVIGVEATGALYTAWPLDAMLGTRLAHGNGIALPGAVALDDSHGRETLYLVECGSRDALDSCRAEPGSKPHCDSSCELSPFVLEKP